MATRIGFSTQRWNPLSWVIRTISGSRASHAWFLYFDDDFQMDMVMDAHETGFRLIPLTRFEKWNTIIKIVTPHFDIDKGMKDAGRNWLGSMYDFGGLFGMAVVVVGKWLKRKWKNPFVSANHVFCSESVVRAMVECEGYSKLGLDPNAISPEDLLKFFEKEETPIEAAKNASPNSNPVRP